jgi:protein-disulfide isomerase
MPGTTRIADRIATGALVLLAICAVVFTASNVRRAFFPSSNQLTEPADSVEDWARFGTGGNRVGPDRATVTLLVFSDYQCPSCLELFTRLEVIRRLYPRDVAVIWRHLPLEGHRLALPAAQASVCASRAGHFEEMHRLLFLKRDSVGIVSWSRLAVLAGIRDTAAFGDCLRSDVTQAQIQADIAAADTLRAVGTPTLLINGRKYIGVPQDLRRIVQYVRRHAS